MLESLLLMMGLSSKVIQRAKLDLGGFFTPFSVLIYSYCFLASEVAVNAFEGLGPTDPNLCSLV